MTPALSIVVRNDSDLEAIWAFMRRRTTRSGIEVSEVVARIVGDFQADPSREALVESARRFDATEAGEFELFVTDAELNLAHVEEHRLAAIRVSVDRVRRFHVAQLAAIESGWSKSEEGWSWEIPATDAPGTGRIGQRMSTVRRAGIYVPGGKAQYPSSVIMNAVPASVAGVEEIVVATPARADGSLSPAVLVAAREVGVRTILKVGGAAAIAGLAIGFDGFDPVDLIVGPGNAYVNEAKRLVWGRVGLDGLAGPSEVCVVADEYANPRLAALDLLTQIEHAGDNFGALIALSESMRDAILSAAEEVLESAPRASIMRSAFESHGLCVVARTIDEAIRMVNRIAPEHLSLMVSDPRSVSSQVRNAGCILVGPWSGQSAADYCLGPSHTLPTSGGAKFGSPLSVQTFLRTSSVAELSEPDAAELARSVSAFAEMEGLPTHGDGRRFKQ